MEFTRDEYIVVGKRKVSVRTINGDHYTKSADKVIIKNNWIVVQDGDDVSVFNRDNISSFDIEFEEG